jgi:hypothetical protein
MNFGQSKLRSPMVQPNPSAALKAWVNSLA